MHLQCTILYLHNVSSSGRHGLLKATLKVVHELHEPVAHCLALVDGQLLLTLACRVPVLLALKLPLPVARSLSRHAREVLRPAPPWPRRAHRILQRLRFLLVLAGPSCSVPTWHAAEG